MAFNEIRKVIDEIEIAKFYFFTDGTAPYPEEAFKKIENDFN